MSRILIVEDDQKLRKMIEGGLRRYGLTPIAVADFSRVRDEFVAAEPDLVLLDVNLPYYDGFFWCRQIRAVSKVPVVFLSCRTGDTDQVFAMENGADDYVTKPFSLEVLIAKIRSVLRRTSGEYAAGGAGGPAHRIEVSGLTLDEDRGVIFYQGRRADVSPTETRLLSILLRSAGRIVPRDTLLEQLWDDVSFVDDNTLTVNVSRVRRKLEDLGFGGAIITRRGQGYLIEPASPPGDHAVDPSDDRPESRRG